ncbi:MAG TPA: electron transfer flavoprotein subunit beta/FixA family protein [Candidatus Hydrogenedentes bacterium]|nr:electron transfer flavoprotein subunit beta/FixA family protein [Candidatus Hydrogenedentota bacterium]
MKIAVLIKRVPDTASVFKIGADGKSIDMTALKYVMSPYDEHAVEEAIKLKEANGAEVVVVSLGPAETKETIRSALAMGADWGLLVTGADTEGLTGNGVAQVLAAAVRTLNPDLIFAGKQAVDDDASQVPERVAELLELPHASVITRFELAGDRAVVDREIEGGQYTLEVPLPALFTAQKGINTPRYPTLPNIMKAKKKEIKDVSLADLGLAPDALRPGLVVEALALPRQDRLNKILDGETPERVRALVSALRDDEKVL